MTYLGSPTRARFLALKKAKRQQRADDLWRSEHTFYCKGERMGRRGLQPCKWEVRFRYDTEGATAVCRKCTQVHRAYGGKWFKADEYEMKAHDLKLEEARNRAGDYKRDPQYAPWETPAHEPDCGYKDVDLLGLSRKERKMAAGPSVIKIGIAMVDRSNKVRHWCRPLVASGSGPR